MTSTDGLAEPPTPARVRVLDAAARAAGGPAIGALAASAIREAAGDKDLVLALPGLRLPDGWVERLATAAREPLVAAAVALTLDDLPDGGITLDATGGEPSPRVPASASPVLYLTRAGLAVTGPPDERLEDWDDVVTDLIQRAALGGLTVVAARDLVLPPAPGTTPSGELDARYPWLPALRDEAAARASAPGRALATARRAVHGLDVTLDLRSLGPVRMGTQTHALGLALALAEAQAADLRLLVAPDLHPEVAELLTAQPGTALLPYEDALGGVPPTAVVHRPQQVNTADDLALLLPLGARLVVTHQDLIGYRNPGYHASVDAWLQHRRMTRYALQVADRVLFFSGHARDDAVAEDLLDPAWADVVGLGVEPPRTAEEQRPAGVPEPAVGDDGFLLFLGADLRHKQRPFALDLLTALRDEHGFGGRLVLAGPEVEPGGTRAEEDARLRADPELNQRVTRLGSVSEAEKHWLLRQAALVVYPTVDEGFGLLPFEAAAAGTPCAFAPAGALPEVLSGIEPLLVPWDATASAARVIGVLRDAGRAAAHVAAIRDATRAHGWRQTAERVLGAYERAVTTPRRGVSWEARDHATSVFDLERLLPHVAELEVEITRLRAFADAVGEDGTRLVGPEGFLSPADRRALLSVVARPALRKPFLAALRSAYRLGRGA